MRRFAFLIALIAWLFSSLMPALALSGPHDHSGPAPVLEAMPHSLARSGQRQMSEGAHDPSRHALASQRFVRFVCCSDAGSGRKTAGHLSGTGLGDIKTAPACQNCADKPAKPACAMSLCAACTSLVPALMLTPFRPATADRPARLAVSPMAGLAPGPVDPPPRV